MADDLFMPDSGRLRRLVQGQGGSTLIELLVALPIALALLGIILQALGDAGTRQVTTERRTEALSSGQLGLERMTREVRQADWVYFRSSSVVDLNAPVRGSATSTGVKKLIRYDCTTDVCIRSEGPETTYPPPSLPTFTKSAVAIGDPASDTRGRYGQIVLHDIFRPTRVNPDTGVAGVDYLNPDFLQVQISIDVRDAAPIVLQDGVSLRNRTGYAG